jgi:Tfp pilus assembly protein PilN
MREKNLRLASQYKKLEQENEFLLAENKQVTKIMAELEKMKQNHQKVKQKCEKLLEIYKKFRV